MKLCYIWNKMMLTEETTLVDEIVEVLGALPGVQVTRRPDEHSDFGAEHVIDLTTPCGNGTYGVVTRLNVTRATLEAVIAQVKRLEGVGGFRPLLATTYLPDTLAASLTEADLNFVDTAGNMSLQGSGLYAVVRGRKSLNTQGHDAFTATGLKIVYALLAYPPLQQSTYRSIQTATGVSLASVSRTIGSLLEQGHLLRGKDGVLYIAQFRDLLSRWELGYLEVLRPKLAPTAWRYSSVDRSTALDMLKSYPGVLIGGEEAAARLTNYLKPQTLTLHADLRVQKELRAAFKLLPARETPDLYLTNLPVPYDLTQARTDRLAAPLLVRAELLAYGGDRLHEVANRLLDEVLALDDR